MILTPCFLNIFGIFDFYSFLYYFLIVLHYLEKILCTGCNVDIQLEAQTELLHVKVDGTLFYSVLNIKGERDLKTFSLNMKAFL
jgi:hypothetical protein